ncbi:hypothetical protein TREPR_3694 [Treponema primitia ZAS-2]|uniref:Uncharacterized protein n=1 Tax=Treponema primitia (strain ATCC BAA-887 / DSM 12427 / ZAS-2) TaxID=545694 RepID=F5YQD7_TREPZ|nr:hypothetical protein TREPR_3694 [Treponema primitia ZAS-2]
MADRVNEYNPIWYKLDLLISVINGSVLTGSFVNGLPKVELGEGK